MTKIKYVLSGLGFLVLVGSLISCSSNGRSVSKVALCPTNYDPINLEKATKSTNYSNKLDFKAGDIKFDETGEFKYVSSQIYYYDPTRDIKLHFSYKKSQVQEKDKDNNFQTVDKYSAEQICVGGRGIRPNMQPIVVDIPITSDLKVEANNRVSYTIRNVHLVVDPSQKHLYDFKKIDETPSEFTPGLPIDLYSLRFPVADQFYFKVKGENPKSPHDLVARIELSTREDVTDSTERQRPPVEIRLFTRVQKVVTPSN